jgi:hypothetical protein
VRRLSPLLACLVTALALALPAAAETVWIEGESPTRSAVTRHPHWYDQVKRDALSGGDWISHFDEARDGRVAYDVAVKGGGTYAFWLRANPVKARLFLAVDGGREAPIDLERDIVDATNIAADGKPDLRFIGWKKVADLDLKPGKHTLAFRFASEAQHHGAIDALVLTTEPFVPAGTARPGAARVVDETGTWPFQPARDTFRPDALLDLRSLNEPVAGASGFVRLSVDREGFVRGDGQPLRFWAVTDYVQRDGTPDDLKHHARFLAKRGVNLVRYHGHLEPKGPNSRMDEVDEKGLDEAWRLVAAMKAEGIYSMISPYWAANLKKVPATWGYPDWPTGTDPQGLLFFDEKLQAAYRGWLKALLGRKNPYTGIPLAADPAVAVIQLQNEDSLLFWTAQNLKGRPLEALEAKFEAFAKAKHGSIAKALAAWKGTTHERDAVAQGRLGIHQVWFWTRDQKDPGLDARLADQLQFFAETMHRFNAETARYLREELGCKQLVNAGNWRTADTLRLGDVERWTYTANEVSGLNAYYSPPHLGPDRGWRINVGDTFANRSALRDPRAIPFNVKLTAGQPMVISESHWVPPLGYQSEAPFLVAAYNSLTGLDVFTWFGTGATEWADRDPTEWNSASRAKWTIATPMVLGQFPAAALAFRRGDIARGEPVVEEHRPLASLWARDLPLIAEDARYDPNRDLGDAAARSSLKTAVDPLAFLVGPVRVHLDSPADRTRVADLSPFLDRPKGTIRSNTGQLALDATRGVATLDAPRVQGASGFLDGTGEIALSTVAIRSRDPYATILVVALDDRALAESDRVLVQVGTIARPTGWATQPTTLTAEGEPGPIAGEKILRTGTMPWRIVKADASIRVRNPRLARATVLDVNGNAVRDVPATRDAQGLALTLPPDALYVVLRPAADAAR